MKKLARTAVAVILVGVGVGTIFSRKPALEDIIFSTQNTTQNLQVQPRQTIDEHVVQAVIQIESNGNPNAQRYEAHIDDTSYGLMQILTGTARELERTFSDLPRLGDASEDVRQSLLNPEINQTYGIRLLEAGFNQYDDVRLAVAAYNAGPLTPRNARVQQQLNELIGASLTLDGNLGPQSREAISTFQREYTVQHPQDPLAIDGRLGPQTYKRIQSIWQERNPGRENQTGIIPNNRYTPNHIRKFDQALKSLVHNLAR